MSRLAARTLVPFRPRARPKVIVTTTMAINARTATSSISEKPRSLRMAIIPRPGKYPGASPAADVGVVVRATGLLVAAERDDVEITVFTRHLELQVGTPRIL